ncbi:MAG: hypothetical protein Q8Q32_02145 [bacterium]|nr:hypothetical protein [bacterium]
MTRIFNIICLALLLGISAACGGGSGGPGRDICEWGYYWDPYEQMYVEYLDCYDDPYYKTSLELVTFPIQFQNSEGVVMFWSPDHEGRDIGLLEFQDDMMEQGCRPLAP